VHGILQRRQREFNEGGCSLWSDGAVQAASPTSHNVARSRDINTPFAGKVNVESLVFSAAATDVKRGYDCCRNPFSFSPARLCAPVCL